VKYAGGGPIVVAVEPASDEVEVHVLDEGPGLPPAASDRLFDLYERATVTARAGHPGGLGIGLFVARAIIDAMGGRVWAINRTPVGSDVGFSLPIISD
jgi:K+-sensing histidine kinase KdpD